MQLRLILIGYHFKLLSNSMRAGISCYIVYILSAVLVLVVGFPSENSQKRDFPVTKYFTSSDRNYKIELPYTIN